MTSALHAAIGMASSAALIGIASLIGKRWGAGAGGSIVALPLVSGPILFTYVIERGPAFAEQACVAGRSH